jgi:hypothetical protein
VIDASLFKNIVTKNKEVSLFIPVLSKAEC